MVFVPVILFHTQLLREEEIEICARPRLELTYGRMNVCLREQRK